MVILLQELDAHDREVASNVVGNSDAAEAV